MSVDNVCKNCSNNCCRQPLIGRKELNNLKNLSVFMKDTNDIPVKEIDENFVQMDNGKQCFFFKEEKGCILQHEDKPIICQLYPFIPHNFKGVAWELLLDVSICSGWSTWGHKYKEVKNHFDFIRMNSPYWVEDEPNESHSD